MQDTSKSLPTSRIYSFLDNTNSHVIHFFEGQKLIHDLIMTHELKQNAFGYFRDSILGAQLLTALLKQGETLGIFIDSENPYFRLKIETNDKGFTRALVYPEQFSHSAKEIDGKVRLTKLFNNNSMPYNSIIELSKSSTKDILNTILDQSYQVDAKIIISDHSDQSVMLFKLPLLSDEIAKKENLVQVDISSSEYWIKVQTMINKLHIDAVHDEKIIIDSFINEGLIYLGIKDIQFKCSCSFDRMLQGIKSLVASSGIDDVFNDDKSEIETRCDYCRTNYIIKRSDI